MRLRFAARARIAALAALSLTSGCAYVTNGQYRAATAGVIGCPSEEITVTDANNVVWAGEGEQWRAECRGRQFICSHSGATACSEELQRAPGAGQVPADSAAAPARPIEAPRS